MRILHICLGVYVLLCKTSIKGEHIDKKNLKGLTERVEYRQKASKVPSYSF